MIHIVISVVLSNISLSCSDGTLKSCPSGIFWVQEAAGRKKTLVDPRTGKPLQVASFPSLMSGSGLPLGRATSSCPVSLRASGVRRVCRRKTACSLCKLDTSQTFTLRGLADLTRETDRSYRISLRSDHSVSLKGRRNLTEIVEEGGQWLVRRTNDSAHCSWRVTTDQGVVPLGRHVWRRCSSDSDSEEVNICQKSYYPSLPSTVSRAESVPLFPWKSVHLQ